MSSDNSMDRTLNPLANLPAKPAVDAGSTPKKPSSLYRAELWRLGHWAARHLPPRLCTTATHFLGSVYWIFSPKRREVVIQNLLPVMAGNRKLAVDQSKKLFRNFGKKLVDLWRYESGEEIESLFGSWTGWEHFQEAQQQKRGVLILTPHLGNWEFGAPLLAQAGIKLLVLTLEEPDARVTEMRKASRERWGIETLVIGRDTFAFVEVIRRLEAGAAVALLVDRPLESSAMEIDLFGHPFAASIAPAELARASGCTLLPVYLPRTENGYVAHALPPITYDRAALRGFEPRRELTQRIMRAFEQPIREYPSQWYHFIPIWKA